MPKFTTRSSPVNTSALPVQSPVIDKDPDILKKSSSGFMLEVACRKAEFVLPDQCHFFLDEAEYRQFEDLLRAPVPESVNNLLANKAPWE